MKAFFPCLLSVWFGGCLLSAAESAEAPVSFVFREPAQAHYQVERKLLSGSKTNRIEARSVGGGSRVELTSRLVLQVKTPADAPSLLAGSPLKRVREVRPGVFILQAEDALSAAQEAQRLAQLPEVLACAPVMRRSLQLHGPYARKPNDPYAFNPNPNSAVSQWHLENRNPNDGSMAGANLNVRAAWPYTHGEGVVIAVADDGVEYTHPDLASRAQGMPHFNFGLGTTNGLPDSSADMHATATAGLAAAEMNNGLGVAGVAPGAQLASWKMFSGGTSSVSDEQLMDLFQYCSNSVAVQNHSWGSGGDYLQSAGLLASLGIANAIQYGRNGLGVVMVRSAGNDRLNFANAEADGLVSDPRIVAVGAVRSDGRVASYSNPGACLLVAAPSGDSGFPGLVTTDRQGAMGYNQSYNSNDPASWDYNFGFSGTSGSAPQIAGIAALVLSANPNLTYRDVQQILILSARHFDLADPGIVTNGAGFRVSHNVGFGVPDAGVAVDLARSWVNRPPLTNVTVVATNSFTTNNPAAIPDDGLRVLISGATNLSIPASPSWGLHPDDPTAALPLVDVGLANGPITQNLTNKAALIQRGINNFSDKIQNAAAAGAAFAIVFNNTGGTNRVVMGSTDFAPIPAVFIGQNDGDGLSAALLQTNLQAQLNLFSTNYCFLVTNTLLCEHVALRVQTDHPSRSDFRITLVSPQGTRSILERINNDRSPLADWTYYSTHHFYESSCGTWTLCVSDEDPGVIGSVTFASLTVYGVPIIDSDNDGLDDRWEMAHFGTLAYGPQDDPDGDGYNNMREQIMGTDPNKANASLPLDLSLLDSRFARLSWPGAPGSSFDIYSGTTPSTLSLLTNLNGTFPTTEWTTPYTNAASLFFTIRGHSSH